MSVGVEDRRDRGRGGRASQPFLWDGVEAGREVRAGLARRSAACRPLPMEDLCFFVKPIDNSRLVQVMDPRSKWEILKMVVGGLFLLLMALGYALPYLEKADAGYRIQDLRNQNEALVEHTKQLQVEKASLEDPRRVAAEAAGLGLRKPTAEQVVWAEGAAPANPMDLVAQNLNRIAVEGR